MNSADRGSASISFTVPAGAGNFAPEVMYLKPVETTTPGGIYSNIERLRVLVENLIATAVVVIEILRQGGNPNTAGDWIDAGPGAPNLAVAGLSPLIELAGASPVRIRCKSGGTGGAQRVSAWWN